MIYLLRVMTPLADSTGLRLSALSSPRLLAVLID
jgi:hypothetical protein